MGGDGGRDGWIHSCKLSPIKRADGNGTGGAAGSVLAGAGTRLNGRLCCLAHFLQHAVPEHFTVWSLCMFAIETPLCTPPCAATLLFYVSLICIIENSHLMGASEIRRPCLSSHLDVSSARPVMPWSSASLNELLNCLNMDGLVLKMLVFGRKVLEQLSAAAVTRLFRLKVTLSDELH